MTEPQVRGTDRNEAAETLSREIRYRVPLTHEYLDGLLDAALDWERRRTVERVRQALGEPDTAVGINEDWLAWGEETVRAALDEVAALDPATPGEEDQHER